MTTVNVQDPIYQVLWEHAAKEPIASRTLARGLFCQCGIEFRSRPAHWQHVADAIRADSPTEKCIRCGGTDDLKDRGMAPGMTFCKWCREALAWRDRALNSEEEFEIVMNAYPDDFDPDRPTAEQIAEMLAGRP